MDHQQRQLRDQAMAALIHRLSHRATNVAYGIGLGALAAVCSFNYFHAQIAQPYTGITVKAEPEAAEIVYGSPLVIRVGGIRDRICAVMVARAYVSVETGEMIHQERVPAGFVPLGPFSVAISMQLPDFMKAGDYIFKGQQINDCGQETITVPYPDVPFRIINQN